MRIADPPPQTGNPNFTEIDPGQLYQDPLMIIDKKIIVFERRGGGWQEDPKNRSNCKRSKWILSTWHLIIILVRGSHLCKSEQPHDVCKCAHGLCKPAYESRHNESRRGKIIIEKKTVLKAKSACQAAATRTHKVEPSGRRDVDFCRESSDENRICEKAIKTKVAKK